jgi:SAM-dependent methyltransferase
MSMKSIDNTKLHDVPSIYGGPQGELLHLLMGDVLHPGGMNASLNLAERAGIGKGHRGIDLCCGMGGTMRVLVRFREVASMTGVDLTPRNVERGEARCRAEGFADRIRIVLGDACATDLPDGSAEFVWGEDAWCYLPDKPKLIAEAVRLVERGGTIAFTDWVEGRNELSPEEARRALTLMDFPNIENIAGYVDLLNSNGCEMRTAEDTARLAPIMDLNSRMIEEQFTYDVLATVAFRKDLFEIIRENFRFLGALARAGKLIQARFIATRQ